MSIIKICDIQFEIEHLTETQSEKITGGGDGNGGGSDDGGCFPPDSDTTAIRVISYYDTL
jgi:hypothetical protein